MFSKFDTENDKQWFQLEPGLSELAPPHIGGFGPRGPIEEGGLCATGACFALDFLSRTWRPVLPELDPSREVGEAVQTRPWLESTTPASSKFDCEKYNGAFNLNPFFVF